MERRTDTKTETKTETKTVSKGTLLVTGGTGYIGSHCCVELILAGYGVVIIDNLSNSKEQVIDEIEVITGIRPKFYFGDVQDALMLDKIFCENQIDGVLHFAGLKAVGESVEKPLTYYNVNLISTLALLEAMEKNHCYKLVFSSSATVYGNNTAVPFIETLPMSTLNPYGTTKRLIEELLNDYAKHKKDMRISILRYFNPVGAHESARIGENPNGIPNNLFPYICKVAAGEYPYLSVYGDDYETPDGTGVRDYIHVVDLADGHVKALEYLGDHTGVHTFNLGTGIGYSVLEAIKAFEKVNKVSVPYKITKRREGDIGSCYAQSEKAKTELGWSAKKTLEDMCFDCWKYIKKEARS